MCRCLGSMAWQQVHNQRPSGLRSFTMATKCLIEFWC